MRVYSANIVPELHLHMRARNLGRVNQLRESLDDMAAVEEWETACLLFPT